VRALVVAALVLACASIARAQPAPPDAGVPPLVDVAPPEVAPVDVAPVEVAPPEPENRMTLPLGKGLPVVIRAGVYFVSIDDIDESAQTFDATIDVRLRWEDPRLRFPKADVPGGVLELRNSMAEARLEAMWTPEIRLDNLIDEPYATRRGVYLSWTGEVELITRTSGKFGTPFDMTKFPFDKQQLEVALMSEREDLDHLIIDYRQDELDFSRLSRSVELDDWAPGLVELRREPVPGWRGTDQARIYAALQVNRHPGKSLAAIFIPLIASLLIPMLAMWLERVEDGEVKIEAFELANVVIGGLFAVIALNFTISSEYPTISGSDNTVTRLLALNYVTLGLAVIMNLVIFRFDLIKRWFGRYAQDQLFKFLIWGLPLMVFATAAAFVLASMA